MQRHKSAVTLRDMFLLLCTSSVIAHARGSTNTADEVLHTEDNHCKPIMVNGVLMPTVPEYMPSFPVTLKGIKRQFVCKLSASTTTQKTTSKSTTGSTTSHTTTTTPSTTSREATTNSKSDSTTHNPTTTSVSTTHSTTSSPSTFASTTSREATTNSKSDSTTHNPTTTTESPTAQDTTTMSTTESPTLHPTTATQSTAKLFVTGEHGIFVAHLLDDLDFTSIPSTSSLCYITYDSVAKKIYWTDYDEQRVYRADADGGHREEVTFRSNNGPRGIAIAESSRILYIANTGSRKITTVDIGQGSALPRNETNFVTGLSNGLGSLEVDEEQGFLYWSEYATILRKSLNGSGSTETVYHNDDLTWITGLSIDLSRNPRRIFFCDFNVDRTFYKDVDQPLTMAHELTDYINDPDINGDEERNKLRDISYFNGALYWVKKDSPGAIAVMTEYDQSSRSFDIKETSEINYPKQMLIINVNP